MRAESDEQPCLKLELERQLETLHQQVTALQQEKADLAVVLDTTTAHANVIEVQLRQTHQKLQAEVFERQRAQATLQASESRLASLLSVLSREKADLEIRREAIPQGLQRDIEPGTEDVWYDKALAAISQSEEQFRLIAEAAPIPMLISRIVDGAILYANTTAGRALGIPPQVMQQHKTQDFYVEPSERKALLDAYAKDGYVHNFEIRCRRIDGSIVWGLLSVTPFLFKGELTFLSVFGDITDRKIAEDALRIAEANYRSIFENAVEGIFQTTPDGRYIRVNTAMARIHGYDSPAKMLADVGQIERQIYVDPDRRVEFMRLLQEQDQVKDFEFRAYRRDRSTVWVSEYARAVRDGNGDLLYYEGIVTDITRRKQEEEALKRQVQLLQIEIDERKRDRQVAEITQTDYFQQLQVEVDRLRQQEEI